MKYFFILLLMLISTNLSHSYLGVYVGWENFISPVLPENTKANNLVFGLMGNTPTRVYFYYNVYGHVVLTSGAEKGRLGWGAELAGGLGYRFLNTAHKRSGWDLGLDAFGYFTPFFLNSETGYVETALYYGVGLGLSTMYKFNPHIGLGVRASLKYNIGTNYLASKIPSAQGILFTIGTFLTF
ncbi:MAG: hypothetical protein ACRC0X_04370 [Brevinema sp.]